MLNRRSAVYILSVGAAVLPLVSGCKSPDAPATPVSSVQQHVDVTVNGMGHYCSMIESTVVGSSGTGAWVFSFDPAGGDPCADVPHGFTGVIARAGLYSPAGNNGNNLVVRCKGGYVKTYPDQQYPFVDSQALMQIRTDTQNSNLQNCVFTLAPKALPIFDSPIPAGSPGPNYGFDFTRPNYYFGQTNCVNSFFASTTNYAGQDKTCAIYAKNDSDGYFWMAGNAGPLYAVAPGVVRSSRIKQTQCCNGSPDQKELYIEHTVGSGYSGPNADKYIEKFVTAYYHISDSLFADGAQITPTQGNPVIVAHFGQTGCTDFLGVHFAVYRLTNTATKWHDNLTLLYNITDPSNDGYRTAIDPYGFSGANFDPWAYLSYDNKMGALSINLWKSGQAPPLGTW